MFEYKTLWVEQLVQVDPICNEMAKAKWRTVSMVAMQTRGGATAGMAMLFERAVVPSRSSGMTYENDR